MHSIIESVAGSRTRHKMRINFILIIIVLTMGAVHCDKNLIIKNIKPEICDTSTMHTLQLVSAYFSNQEVIILIVHDVKTTVHRMDNVILKCIVTRLKLPLYHYHSARELQLHNPTRETNFMQTPSITSCYAVVGETYDELAEDLRILSRINPSAKFIFVLRNKSLLDGEKLLRLAWQSYRMMRLLFIMHSDQDDVHHINAIIYNPFICRDTECGERGQFYQFHITEDNEQATIDEIMRLMELQVSNLYKYPLRIYMYEWKSFARAVRNPVNKTNIIRFRLLDGEILSLIGRHMNFKMVFVGDVFNNTIDGSVRSIEREDADIAANSRIISDYSANNTVFLTHLYLVTLTYMVPKQYTNKLLNVFIYSMFDWNTEIIMIVTFIFLILMWYLLNYCYEQFTKQSEANSIPRSLIIVTASQYFVSIKFTKFLKGHQQILLGSMLLYSIVVSSNFQSSIVKQLATDVEDRDINTIEQLVNSPYTIRYVQTLHDFLKIPTNLPETSTLYKLYKKQAVLNRPIDDRVPGIAYNRTLAILCTKLVAEEFTSQYLDETNGRPLIHIVRQPLSEFYYSYIVPKTSPYRLRFNEIIRRAVEGGILKHEQQLIEQRTKLNAIRAVKQYGKNQLAGGNREYKGVTIQQIKTLFVVWGYMLTLACFVFVIELSVFYLYPQYQKYHDKHVF